MPFVDGTKILDVGTGGGFPGIPLAIIYPNCTFHLVDSIGKKIKVVNEVIQALDLKNVTAEHTRAEKIKGSYDFVVCRAVTRMKPFLHWVSKSIHKKHQNLFENGILALKGGDLSEELKETNKHYRTTSISTYFQEDFFETKQVVYLKV